MFRLMIWAVVQNMAPSLQPGALARSVKNVSSTAPVMFGLDSRTSLAHLMPTRGSLLTTQLVRLGRSKVTELCSRTGPELDLADQALVVVSISTPVGQIPFSVPQIASRLTRFACCLASRSDRTSQAQSHRQMPLV